MSRIRRFWAAVLIAVVLTFPTTAALAAHQTPASPHHPHYLECQSTHEIDNNQPSGNNPFSDDLGNTWLVYYDITRDSRDNAPCEMRLVVRLFNPSPDGSWNGTLDVYAYVNGSYNSYSFGKVSGSSTYQSHFVWRASWLGADYGSYFIEVDEFNGNTAYSRASASFTI